ncbi:hypothetical protein Q0F98_18795 [Paenibacillus amylolyticus]|nr:hypothetical protein Q0F98_18795 [Paenibacillus amylolyticus]
MHWLPIGTSLDFIEMLSRNNGMIDVLDKDGTFQWNDGRILDTPLFYQKPDGSRVYAEGNGGSRPAKRTDMFYAGKRRLSPKRFLIMM